MERAPRATQQHLAGSSEPSLPRGQAGPCGARTHSHVEHGSGTEPRPLSRTHTTANAVFSVGAQPRRHPWKAHASAAREPGRCHGAQHSRCRTRGRGAVGGPRGNTRTRPPRRHRHVTKHAPGSGPRAPSTKPFPKRRHSVAGVCAPTVLHPCQQWHCGVFHRGRPRVLRWRLPGHSSPACPRDLKGVTVSSPVRPRARATPVPHGSPAPAAPSAGEPCGDRVSLPAAGPLPTDSVFVESSRLQCSPIHPSVAVSPLACSLRRCLCPTRVLHSSPQTHDPHPSLWLQGPRSTPTALCPRLRSATRRVERLRDRPWDP